MRDIPPLRTLALRAVGPPACTPEISFGGPRGKPADSDSDSDDDNDNSKAKEEPPQNKKGQNNSGRGIIIRATSFAPPPEEATITSRLLRSLRDSENLPTGPYVGPVRPNAADVDISHPWIMVPFTGDGVSESEHEKGDSSGGQPLEIENSNHSVETLQQFIDALMESGRAGDSRLGIHFFREWVTAVTGKEPAAAGLIEHQPKRQKKAVVVDESLPLGSLSLHNFASGSIHTFRSMERANVGSCLGTLDLTGVHGLTDNILSNIICSGSFPRLRRLSVKNCRKLTGKGIASIVKLTELCALDVGGCFNVHPDDVLSLIQSHPATKKRTLTEIYASGLHWTDPALEQLIDATAKHLRGLGVGFSPYISGPGLIVTLSKVASTLDRLAVPFCPGFDDAAASALGSKLPKLAVLDIRGCNKVYSLSGMMEGRVTAGAGPLFVLARYSGVSNNSLEETMKSHSQSLTCILDGGGTGGGIRR